MQRLTRRPVALISALVALVVLTGAGYASVLAVTGRLAASLNLTETSPTNLTGVAATVTPSVALNLSYTAGTAAGQIDKKWCDRRTLAASATENLDLAGVLVNEFGVTVTFVKVKAIAVEADAANTNNVEVGGAGVNAFVGPLKATDDVVALKPGYVMVLGGSGAGYAVTAGTGDLLKVTNSAAGTGVTYDICIAGTSA